MQLCSVDHAGKVKSCAMTTTTSFVEDNTQREIK
jgi:hypothetical protein